MIIERLEEGMCSTAILRCAVPASVDYMRHSAAAAVMKLLFVCVACASTRTISPRRTRCPRQGEQFIFYYNKSSR
jgi:hypothetical protein